MNIPKRVKVCGKTYKIEQVKHLEDCGNLFPTECKALIGIDMDPQQIRDTVLHELVHAIEYETHLNMEERQVHALSTAMLDMLRNNKHLVKFLTEN